jgi:uncharacterized membrane protein
VTVKLGDQLAAATWLGTTALTGALFGILPERVPTHFDLQGVADGTMTRNAGAWLVPGIALATWLLVRFGGQMLPADARARVRASPMDVVGASLMLLFSMLQCVVLYAATHRGQLVIGALGLGVGAFWAMMGLVLPRLRRNPCVGVRTPWTLASDENWAKTHRFAGYVFFGTGVLAALLVPLGMPGLAVPLVLVSAVTPVLYSFGLTRTPK